ncbi:hypothetical protein BHF68_00645 [Desulfuribacillus alkaliarsenatis]|uniref:LysM domain-containing protein n=1 Tax=Desulfuribacillus alkaliarsenatis TaxID=766136 RepID=A0A1E5G6E7_9FIRM|nr:hypothetical protein BHF68_00645 [Desulfuribacillus alkaliarsenatis]
MQEIKWETTNFSASYDVVRGDSLWLIAQRHNTTVAKLMEENNLKSHHIWVGQSLRVPAKITTQNLVNSPSNSTNQQQLPRITYHDYYVKSGDTSWNIAIDHGMPFLEFLTLNNLNQNSWLRVGQKVQVAQYNIPINNPDRLDRGAYMDWWTEAQYVFPIGAVAKVTDIHTGLSWYTKRTIGANHADVEPLTARDTQIMLQVWGGQWSWQTRPILIEIDGHRLAASASAMPHDIQFITDNNFNGHYDIYFGNSTRHVDGRADLNHERNVRFAAGIQ